MVFGRLTAIATGAAIVVAAGSLAGCGSTATTKRLDKQEYLHQINETASGDDARKATRLFNKIVIELPQTQRSCRDRTREFHQVLDRIVDSVEQLNSPADIAPLQRELVAAARESVRTVGQAADDVGDGKLHCGRSMNRRIYGLPSTARAEAVLSEYAKRGYIFGLNSQD